MKSVTGKTTEKDILSYISSLDAAGIRTFADTVYQNVKNMSADYTTKNDEFSVDQGYYLITETKVGTTGKPAQTGSVSLVMLDTAGNKDISVKTKDMFLRLLKKLKMLMTVREKNQDGRILLMLILGMRLNIS